jgi:translation initiation factor 2 alpha subunit (eIF-2alpha)
MVYFFENMSPKVGDRVICKIINFTNAKIVVELLEYDNKPANIFFNELAFKSIYKMKKNYKKDMILPLEVINAEADIDLSTFSLDSEETKDLINKFNSILRILKFFDYNENDMLRKTLLKSYEDYDNVINLFYKDVAKLYTIVNSWGDSEFLDKLKKCFKPNKLYVEIYFELSSDRYFGLRDIQYKISSFEDYVKTLDENVKINYIYLGAPNYKFILKNMKDNTDSEKIKLFIDNKLSSNEIIKIINYNILDE